MIPLNAVAQNGSTPFVHVTEHRKISEENLQRSKQRLSSAVESSSKKQGYTLVQRTSPVTFSWSGYGVGTKPQIEAPHPECLCKQGASYLVGLKL